MHVEIAHKVLFLHQIFDLVTNFQRKFDNNHCNEVEKQLNCKNLIVQSRNFGFL